MRGGGVYNQQLLKGSWGMVLPSTIRVSKAINISCVSTEGASARRVDEAYNDQHKLRGSWGMVLPFIVRKSDAVAKSQATLGRPWSTVDLTRCDKVKERQAMHQASSLFIICLTQPLTWMSFSSGGSHPGPAMTVSLQPRSVVKCGKTLQ